MNDDSKAFTGCPRLPFYIADAVILAVALGIAFFSKTGLDSANISIVSLLVLFGLFAFVAPFFIDAFIIGKQTREESARMTDNLLERIKELESAEKSHRQRAHDLGLATEEFNALKKHLDEIGAQVHWGDVLSQNIKNIGQRLDAFESASKKAENQSDQAMEKLLMLLKDKIASLELALAEVQAIARTNNEDSRIPEKGAMLQRALGKSNGLENGGAMQKLITAPINGTQTQNIPETQEIGSETDATVHEQTGQTKPLAVPESKIPEGQAESPKPEEPKENITLEAGEPAEKPRTRRSNTSKNQAGLILHWMIGFGNKPYLRIKGNGQKGKKGELMAFLQIGKWKWQMQDDFTEPVTLTLWKNDEEQNAEFGEVTLQPGEFREMKIRA